MTLGTIRSREFGSEASVLTIAAASLSPKAVLEAQWRRHMLRLTDLSIQLYDDGPDDGPDDAGDSGDSDAADQTALRASIETVRNQMYAVEDALDRLARGSYGSCEDCSRPIDQLRLAGLPASRFCRRCHPVDPRPVTEKSAT